MKTVTRKYNFNFTSPLNRANSPPLRKYYFMNKKEAVFKRVLFYIHR